MAGEIGETLRERRMAMKIDVHEVEEETKIRAKYLRALENEEYNLLPGQAYVKSFLRTYAEYLGLDSRELVDQYRAQGHRSEEDIAMSTRGPEPDTGRRLVIAGIVVVVLIAIILFALGALGGSGV